MCERRPTVLSNYFSNYALPLIELISNFVSNF